MPTQWSPRDIHKLLVVSTACCCLVILVGSICFGAVMGKISAELLGEVKGGTAGTGLLGLAVILYMVIKAGLGGSDAS